MPEVKSLLMDERTLCGFESLWGREESMNLDQSVDRFLDREELQLLLGLRSSRFGGNVRLEQERVPISWLLVALGRLRLISTR